MKKVSVKVIDKNTLELMESANVGDLIDLLNVHTDQIDGTNVHNLYDKMKDKSTQLIIEQNVKNLEKQKQIEIKDAIHQKELELIKVNAKWQQEQQKLITENEILKKSVDEQIKQKEESLKPTIELEIKKEYDKKIESLNEEIKTLESQNKDKTVAIAELKRESFTSTKLMGEELEQWVVSQVEIAFSDNKDFKIYKDSQPVEGHMGDFVVEYSLNGEKVLSIMIECKTESNVSKNTRANKDHYAKLAKDAKNKRVDFSILCSELELKQNFAILPVKEYSNMYVVRPDSLISLLKTLISYVAQNADRITTLINLKKDNWSQDEFRLQFNNFASPIIKQIKWISDGINSQREYGQKLIKMGNDILKNIDSIDKHIGDLGNSLNEENPKFRKIVKLLKAE